MNDIPWGLVIIVVVTIFFIGLWVAWPSLKRYRNKAVPSVTASPSSSVVDAFEEKLAHMASDIKEHVTHRANIVSGLTTMALQSAVKQASSATTPAKPSGDAGTPLPTTPVQTTDPGAATPAAADRLAPLAPLAKALRGSWAPDAPDAAPPNAIDNVIRRQAMERTQTAENMQASAPNAPDQAAQASQTALIQQLLTALNLSHPNQIEGWRYETGFPKVVDIDGVPFLLRAPLNPLWRPSGSSRVFGGEFVPHKSDSKVYLFDPCNAPDAVTDPKLLRSPAGYPLWWGIDADPSDLAKGIPPALCKKVIHPGQPARVDFDGQQHTDDAAVATYIEAVQKWYANQMRK